MSKVEKKCRNCEFGKEGSIYEKRIECKLNPPTATLPIAPSFTPSYLFPLMHEWSYCYQFKEKTKLLSKITTNTIFIERLRQSVRLYSPPHGEDSERLDKEEYESNRSEWFVLQEELEEFLLKLEKLIIDE